MAAGSRLPTVTRGRLMPLFSGANPEFEKSGAPSEVNHT